jgi:DNA-binding transcriptional MocR family regulator
LCAYYRYPPLREELRKLVAHYFQPVNAQETDLIVTVGSQHGMSALIDMMMEEKDAVVIPKPVYAGTLAVVRANDAQLCRLNIN